MKLIVYSIMFGYVLPAFIVHLFETFASNYDQALDDVLKEDPPLNPSFNNAQFYKDVIKWCPIVNIVASVMFIWSSTISMKNEDD